MNFYKVKYSKSAEKFIKKNKAIGIRFFKAFAEIAEDRENIQTYDVKKFHSKNYDDIFRLRIGDYRAVFRIVDDELLVYVFDIGSRGDIYKRLNTFWNNPIFIFFDLTQFYVILYNKIKYLYIYPVCGFATRITMSAILNSKGEIVA